MRRCLLTAIVLSFFCSRITAEESPDNPVLRTLLESGVPLGGTTSFRLPAPWLADDLTPVEQRSVVTDVAGRYGWDRFVRDSAVAPFVLELAYVRNTAGQRVGHAIDLAFVVSGTLQRLEDEQLADQLLPSPAGSDSPFPAQVRELDETAFRPDGMQAGDAQAEQFVHVQFPLLNRVFVRGVVRAHRSRTSDALWLAWLLDPRFDTGEHANRWNPIEIDNLGKKELGAAHAYQGYGGYVKVTPLDEPADALFIEAHIVFHEPPAWFNTSNLLRSKMPLAIQENIRKFRRQLDRLETRRE